MSGRSVGDLIREAIDVTYPEQGEAPLTQADAAAALLAAEPIQVEDWAAMKRLRDETYEEQLREGDSATERHDERRSKR